MVEPAAAPAPERRASAARLAAFPLSYAAHLAEESWGGEGFASWFSRVFEAHFSRADFLRLNAVAFAAMFAATLLAWRQARLRWLEATLGSLVALNAAAHVLATLVTGSYSPGVVTGVVLWAPLGVFALARGARTLAPRRLVLAILAGVLAHALVTLAALNL